MPLQPSAQKSRGYHLKTAPIVYDLSNSQGCAVLFPAYYGYVSTHMMFEQSFSMLARSGTLAGLSLLAIQPLFYPYQLPNKG